jgi:predicted aminopeptidase
VVTYHGLAGGFERVLRDGGGDLPAFYAEVRRLAALPAERRHAELLGVVQTADAAGGGGGG